MYFRDKNEDNEMYDDLLKGSLDWDLYTASLTPLSNKHYIKSRQEIIAWFLFDQRHEVL